MHNLRRLIRNTVFKGRRKIFDQPLRNNVKCMCSMECPPEARNILPEEKTETGALEFSIPRGIFGQPTCHSHPHIIQEGHLTCGITQMEYRQRRDMLVNVLVSEVDNQHLSHIIVIPAAPKQYMSDKIPYVFRQNSDFFYLTGCLEPSAILVIVKPPQTNIFKSSLFVQEKDSHAELWEGPRTGCDGAVKLFAVDETMPVDCFSAFINKTASTKPSVLWYQNDNPSNPEIHRTVSSLAKNDHVSLGDPQRAIHLMRVIKSPAEVELMKETCYIGSQAINMAMACTNPGVSEHSINAILDFTSRQAGAEHLAFPPVVAGGARATHIHYVNNNQILDEKDMLLVDSGSQRWLYNSDISRTWPVSGKFSHYHKILYEIILYVQKRLFELLGQHRPPLDQLFDHMCRLLGLQLQQEGIIPKNITGNELIARAYRLCPHHVSHYLGLDVHDAPLVRRNVPVQTNMIVTIEPGIYIRPDDKTVREEFRGIGIRIEDDVLITDGDPLILTETCVKEVGDIEAIVGSQQM